MRVQTRSRIKSWIDYWNAPISAYVNGRHQDAYGRAVLTGIAAYLPTGDDNTTLDWGCGDALSAGRLKACGKVFLFEAAPAIRDRLRVRFGDDPGIKVIDELALHELPANSIDFVLVNSVIQYLSYDQLETALSTFYRLLDQNGTLLIGDVIEPGTPTYLHIATFLHFASRNGFFWPALKWLALTYLSPYRALASTFGISRYSEQKIMDAFRKSGFVGQRLPRNIAVSQLRSSYLARKQNS